MVDLVLLRHGRTDWNHTRRIQGQSDSELDDVGHGQAARAAQALAGLAPDLLWSSDSTRARDTAAYLAGATGVATTYDARLREYALGPREGLLHEEFAAEDPDEYAEFRRGNWDAVVGAEKREAVAARMSEVLDEVVRTTPEDGVAVVVSHGAAIRTAVAALLRWSPEVAGTLRGLDNCGWVILQRATPDDGWRMTAYNRTVPTGFALSEPVG